jgi:hypothetical protein
MQSKQWTISFSLNRQIAVTDLEWFERLSDSNELDTLISIGASQFKMTLVMRKPTEAIRRCFDSAELTV